MPPLPEPVSRQFESKGVWYGFLDEKHYRNTVEGGYMVRDLFTADQMHAYAAPLLARVAELEKDAARYRFIKQYPRSELFDMGIDLYWYGQTENLDAAIDAALAAHKEQP